MLVAMPVFNDRLSPVFDWARHIVIVDPSSSDRPWRQIELADGSPGARVDLLVDREVSVLLCGGISPPLASMLEARGITVVPWLSGRAEDVLCAFVEDRLTPEEFSMPGCRRMRERQCGCGNAHRHRRGRSGAGRGRKGRRR